MNSLRVLVVDDHEVVRKGLRALLETQRGWEVCGEATNGREAVEKKQTSAVRLVARWPPALSRGTEPIDAVLIKNFQ